MVAGLHEHTSAYKARNRPAYNEALKLRGSLTIWFDPAMISEAAPTGKHGGTKRRLWRKIPIGIDEQTLEIRAAELTTSDVADAPMLPKLLGQIPPDPEIASVTAGEAFDTRKCHRFRALRGRIKGHGPPRSIAARGAAAVIPPRKNARPRQPDTPGAIARNEILRIKTRRPDHLATMKRRPPPKPRRNQDALCEPKVREAKLLGQRRMARGFDRQVAEFQIRVAVLNRFPALGIPVTEVVR